jgi:quinol monooxygenase YgiN
MGRCFALKLSESTFGVFDAFENEAGRQAHLEGPIAQALMTKADELFARPPSIEPIEVLGLKNRLVRAELKRSGSGSV